MDVTHIASRTFSFDGDKAIVRTGGDGRKARHLRSEAFDISAEIYRFRGGVATAADAPLSTGVALRANLDVTETISAGAIKRRSRFPIMFAIFRARPRP
jgi:hypothetical protein